MTVSMMVIMYKMCLTSRQVMVLVRQLVTDSQSGFGLDFHLSYNVSGKVKKRTKKKTSPQSAQSFGQQCEHPVRLQSIGNWQNTA